MSPLCLIEEGFFIHKIIKYQMIKKSIFKRKKIKFHCITLRLQKSKITTNYSCINCKKRCPLIN